MSSRFPRCARPPPSTFHLIDHQVSCMSNCIRKCSYARAPSQSSLRQCGSSFVRASSLASRTTRSVFSSTLGLWTFSQVRAQLVSQTLRFISTVIRSGFYRDISEAPDTIRWLIAGVFVPNFTLRTRDVEAFEDMPLAHVRSDCTSRRSPRQAKPLLTLSRRSGASVLTARVQQLGSRLNGSGARLRRWGGARW